MRIQYTLQGIQSSSDGAWRVCRCPFPKLTLGAGSTEGQVVMHPRGHLAMQHFLEADYLYGYEFMPEVHMGLQGPSYLQK